MNVTPFFVVFGRRSRTLLRAGLLPGLLGAALSAQAADWVGLAFPLFDVQVSAPVAGLIQRIGVRPGNQVKLGEPLLELESASQQAELRRRAVLLDDDSELQSSRIRLKALDELLQMTEAVARNSQSVSREELVKARLEKSAAEGRVLQLVAQKARERVEHEQAQLELLPRRRCSRAPPPPHRLERIPAVPHSVLHGLGHPFSLSWRMQRRMEEAAM